MCPSARSCSWDGMTRLRAALQEKDLAVPVVEKLALIQKHILTAQKANPILGCVQSVASTSREVILTLYSAIVTPHLDHCIQF